MRPCPLFGVALAALLGLAPPAVAQDQQRLVTVAARSCPTYEAITANRARNNIMESLKDLGADTPYGVGGVPLNIDPAIEANVQPLCTPIENWAFTLGTGYQSRAMPGVWGSLSKVTGPFSPTIWTKDQVPLRDGSGHPYPGGQKIPGATTITLTPEQVKLAATSSKLWIQGGHADGADHRLRDLRVRRAALRDRQLQRRQRRVNLLSAEHAARVLLRLLRQAGADERDDHRGEGLQPAHRHAPAARPLHREHLVRQRRVLPDGVNREPRPADVHPRRRDDVVVPRGHAADRRVSWA
jgi:hypothetical protein